MDRIFTLFIEDRRYTVPTLRLLESEDDQASIRAAARQELLASEDHRAIEVRAEGGEVILRQSREELRK